MKSKHNPKQSDSAERKSVQFSDLFVLEDIQRLQDIFSESCGVASIITFPDGTPITKPSNFCNLCSNIIRKTEKGLSNCLKSDSVLGRKNSSGPVVRKCLSGGLWDAGASITVANVHIANWLIGQVRNEEIDESSMIAYADEIGVNRDVFMAALQEVPVMSLEQFKKVSNMLFAFATEISEKAYKNLELKRQIAERDNAELELKRNEVRLGSLIKLLQNPIESTQQFLDSALSEAINLTESKVGYIYSYSEEKKQFILNSWSKNGMKECSVDEPKNFYELEETSIWGEAVRQRKPLLINDFKAPNKLKKYSQGNVEFVRFLAVPIFNNDQLVAVVAVANKESDYNQSDIFQLSILLDNVWKASGRKNAETALIENEKRFRNLFENAQEGIFQTTIDGGYISANPALAKMYGFDTPEELMNSRKNLSIDAYFNPEERSNFLKMMDEQGFVKGYEYEVKDKHGNKIWFYEDAKAINDENGKLLYFEGFVVDITERKKTELKLIESEERYKRIASGLTDYLYTVEVKDGKAVETHHSEACLNVTGYSSKEFLADPYLWINMVVPEERAGVAGRFLQILEGKDLPAFEHRIIRKDGEIRWISDTAVPKFNHDGSLTSYDGIIKDITERKRAEELLRNEEEKYRLLIQNSHDIIYTLSTEGIFTFVSPSWTTLLGHPTNEIVGKSFSEFVYADDLPECHIWLKKVIESGQRQEGIEYRVHHNSGKWYWHTSSAVPLRDNSGKVIGFYGTARDITNQKIAEQELAYTKALLNTAFEQSPIPMVLASAPDRTIRMLNSAAAEFLGVNGSEYQNKTLSEIQIPWKDNTPDGKPIKPADLPLSLALQGVATKNMEILVERPDGTKRWELNNGSPIYDGNGKLIAGMTIFQDISERKENQEKLMKSEMMLRTVLDNFPGIVFWKDTQSNYLGCNQSFASGAGLKNPSEIIHKTDFDFPWKNTEAENYRNDDYEVMFNGKEKMHIIEMQHQVDGNIMWLDTSKYPLRDSQGQVIGIFGVSNNITERKLAEDALRESETRYRTVVSYAPVVSFVTDEKGIFTLSEGKGLAKLGLQPGQVVGMSLFDVYCDYPTILDAMNNALSGHNTRLEVNVQGIVFDVFFSPVTAENGKVVKVIGVSNDITDIKQSEEELRQISSRLALATRAGGVGVWDYDLVSENLLWDDQMLALYGIEKSNFKGAYESWKNGLHPDDVAQRDEEIQMAIRGEKEFDTEFRVVWPDGSIHTIKALAHVQRDNSGKAVRMIGTNWDITDLKLIEQALKESEEKFRYLVSEMQVGILLHDPKSEILLSNPKALELLGLSESQLLGKTSFDPDWNVIHEDGSPFPGNTHPVALAIETCQPVRNTVMGVYRPSLADRVWLLVDAVPELNENGTVQQVVVSFIDITERKQAEEALIKSEERYRSFISQVSEGVYRFECDKPMPLTLSTEDQIDFIYDHMFIAECNPAFTKMYGATDENEIMGKGHLDFHGGRYNEVNRELLRKFVLNGYTLESGITEEKNAAGKQIFISNNSLGIIENDHLIRMWGTQVDITETKIAEDLLRASEKMLLESQSIAGLGNYALDIQTGIWTSSAVLDKIFGIDTDYVRSIENWVNLTHPEWNDTMNQYFAEEVIAKRGVFDKEYKIIRKNDGAECWVHGMGKLECNETGEPITMVGTIMDITTRKRAEEETRTAKILLEQTFEQSPIPMVLVSMPEAKIRIANRACLQFLEIDDEPSLINASLLDSKLSWTDYDCNGNLSKMEEIPLPKSLIGIKTNGEERFIITKNGTKKYELVYSSPIIDYNGKIIAGYLIMMDITNRKEAEEKLRDSEEKLSTLFSSMTEMVALHEVVFDEHGKAINYRITDCNDTYTAVTGIKKADAVGKLATEVYQSDEPPYLHEFTQVGITGKSYEYNTYYAPMDKHFMISVVSPKKNHFATITTDITAMRQIQEVITTKNKELENYLYVASHDLRSPLVNIQGFSQRLQKQADAINTFIADHKLDPETQLVLNKITREDIPKTLQFIFSNVTKMDTLINGLLQISRTGRIKMTVSKINMNHLFKTIISGLNFQIAETSSEIILEKLADCYGDENQLNQLFSNIIGNAIKYRDQKRKMIIKIDCTVQFNKILYTISDTGIGIGQRHLERIWDIFYRVDSGSPEAGDGIGLSLAKRITEKHKGKIWAESEEGKGSTFYIELQKNAFEE